MTSSRRWEARVEELSGAALEASNLRGELACLKDEVEALKASHTQELAEAEARGAAAVQARMTCQRIPERPAVCCVTDTAHGVKEH